MKYNIPDLYLKNQEVEFEIYTLKANQTKKYPQIIKGIDTQKDDGLDFLCQMIFENSNLESKGFKAEDLLELPEPILTQIFQKYIYGSNQEVESEKIKNKFKITFNDLEGAEYQAEAGIVSALISRKYKDFTKNGEGKKLTEKQTEMFILGVAKTLVDVIENDLKEEDYLEKFSPYILFTLYNTLALPDYSSKKV